MREELDYERMNRQQIERYAQNNRLAEQRATIELAEQQRRALDLAERQAAHQREMEIRRQNEVQFNTSYVHVNTDVSHYETEISNLRRQVEQLTEINREMKNDLRHAENLLVQLNKTCDTLRESRDMALASAEEARRHAAELENDYRLLGGVKMVPTPRAMVKENKSPVEAPIEPQAHSDSPESAMNRWMMMKSLELSIQSGMQVIYTPNEYEIERIEFMIKNNINHMDEFKIPSLRQHHENVGKWNMMA